MTNPFVLPDHAGVRYYDLTALDGGHLLVMLTNAEWIATKQLQAARVKAGDAKAGSDDPKDKWYPKTTPAAFEAIVTKKGAADGRRTPGGRPDAVRPVPAAEGDRTPNSGSIST